VSAKEIGQELAEIRRLGRLAKDLDRQCDQQDGAAIRVSGLESGFYFNRHVGVVEPLTGATFEQADQPEVRFNGQQGDAYGACPNNTGLYGLLGNAGSVNPDGILKIPRSEANLYDRPDSAHNAYPDNRQSSLSDAQMLEVNKVLQEQTSDRTTELESAETVYPMARMKRDDSSCREGSAIESELWAILQDTPTVLRRVLPYNEQDPDEDDELDMQHWRAKTDTDAKAGATRHPLRQLHGMAKRVGNPADAKVGSTQHSPSKRLNKSNNQWSRFQEATPICALRNTSAKNTRCERQKSAARMDRPQSQSDPSSESSSDTEISVSAKYRMELRNRRRRAGELLQDVHKDIWRLAALAYSHVPSRMREEIACDYFLDALEDPNLVRRIREQRPADLDSALQLALRFKKAPLSDYYVSRCLTSGRTDLAVEALRREIKDMKKWMEFEYRAPRGTVGGYRQPMATRHTTPSIYSGVLSAPLSPCGPHPASHGNRPNFARPTNGGGMGRNDHPHHIPYSNFRCFNCGSPAHRARECPIPSVERSRPEQPPTLPLARRLPNVRPLKSHQQTRLDLH